MTDSQGRKGGLKNTVIIDDELSSTRDINRVSRVKTAGDCRARLAAWSKVAEELKQLPSGFLNIDDDHFPPLTKPEIAHRRVMRSNNIWRLRTCTCSLVAWTSARSCFADELRPGPGARPLCVVRSSARVRTLSTPVQERNPVSDDEAAHEKQAGAAAA